MPKDKSKVLVFESYCPCETTIINIIFEGELVPFEIFCVVLRLMVVPFPLKLLPTHYSFLLLVPYTPKAAASTSIEQCCLFFCGGDAWDMHYHFDMVVG